MTDLVTYQVSSGRSDVSYGLKHLYSVNWRTSGYLLAYLVAMVPMYNTSERVARFLNATGCSAV
jgi:hypothetical protein